MMTKEPLVSIIVPVYNVEDVLGRCLNSIVSQSYHNLEIILINDGSTDKSLEICNNYAKIDKRITVTTTENSGVSKARNLGMQLAHGKYIQFTDSDDVLDLDMIMHLQEAMEIYEADIAFCGMNVSEYDEYNNLRVTDEFTSRMLGKECVLPKQKFMEEFPYILLHTVMLEGPCNRLYRLDILRQNHISFPENLSLGEDLILNFNYYSQCEKIVFLDECGYYYVQHSETALTHRFRNDMFENKLTILKQYKEFMDLNSLWSDEDKAYYASYVVGYIISILKNLFVSDSNLTNLERKREIDKVLNCNLFQENIMKASWIDEEWRWLTDAFKYSDVATTFKNTETFMKKGELISDNMIDDEVKQDNISPGILNRVVRKILHLIQKVIPSKKIYLLENYVYRFGIKGTIKKIKVK